MIIPIAEPVQNDRNMRWFLLNSAHANYAATVTTLTTLTQGHGKTLTNTDGAVANTKVVYAYCTEQQRDAASLTIAGAILDEMNYSVCVNPNYDGERSVTNLWGDTYTTYGIFLERPQRLPTTPVDRVVQHWKAGGETLLYIAQAGAGTEDGSTYANRMSWKDLSANETASYNLIIWCGDLSRLSSESLIAFIPKTGTEASRTMWLGHPVDTCRMLGLTYASWTDDTGAWYTGTAITSTYVVTTQGGGIVRALTKVASVAACKALADSWYPDSGAGRTYVNLADDSNPATTTFFDGGLSIWFLQDSYAPANGKSYFDFYGLKVYQQVLSSVFHDFGHHWRMYGCEFRWAVGGGTWFGSTGVQINKDTGQYANGNNINTNQSRPTIDGRELHGCVITYGTSGLYDTSFIEKTPADTVVRDCYFYGIGHPTDFGVSILATSDSHTVASQGSFDGCTVYNCVAERCCPQNFVIYINEIGFTTNRNKTLTDATITNGTFDTDLTGWTNLSAGGGTVAVSGGKAVFTPGAGTAALEQAVTVGAAYIAITGASFTRSGAVLTLSGSPDLSNLVTSGDNQSVLRTGTFASTGTITATPDANSCSTFRITAFDDVAKTVTVTPTPTLTTAAWFIAHKHVVKFTLLPSQTIGVGVRTATGLAGGSSMQDMTTVTANETTGVAAMAFFVTASPYYLQFSGTASLDTVSALTTRAAEIGYTEGLPAAVEYLEPTLNAYSVCQRTLNINWSKNLVKNPSSNGGSGSGNDNAPISFSGDNGYGYGGQIAGIVVNGNRIESDTANEITAGIRLKFVLPSPYDQTEIEISHNTTRDVHTAFRTAGGAAFDENGTRTDHSFYVHHNDFHATDAFLNNPVISNPDRHTQVLDFNTYRNDDGAVYKVGAGSPSLNFADYKASQPAGDTFDPNSTEAAL